MVIDVSAREIEKEEEILDQQLEISRDGFKALEKVTEFCCSGCGLCASICPLESIEIDETLKRPKLVGECNECGFCYLACPRSFLPLSKIEEVYFGKGRGEEEERLGKFLDLFVARSLTEEIRKEGTPGGTTTAIVHFLMERGYVDAALLTKGRHSGIRCCNHPVPYIASSPEEVLLSSHSKYEISPVLSKLRELSEHGSSLFVGTPCHIMAFRKLQIINKDNVLRNKMKGIAKIADKLTAKVKFAISINCFLNHVGIDRAYERLGIQEKDILKIHSNVSWDLYERALKEGKDYRWLVDHNIVTKDREIKLDEVEFGELVLYSGCLACLHFMVSKHADASVGVCAGETSVKEFGWNSVVIRNLELKKIVDEMVVAKKLEKRPILRGHGEKKRRRIEKFIPTMEVMGVKNYLETGKWVSSTEMRGMRGSHGTEILGLERLFLTQTIRKKLFYDAPVRALREAGAYLTTIY
jgi:coenzyme F420-reducing hydrogenase beta subunit